MKREKSEALVERDKQVISPCSHLSYFPLVVAKGKGAVITDVDGNEFIDFLSSASSLNLGSSDPVITGAIRDQLERFTQYIFAYSYSEQTVAYAERGEVVVDGWRLGFPWPALPLVRLLLPVLRHVEPPL